MNTYRRFSNAAAPYNLYLFEQRLIIKSSLMNVIIISNNKSLNSVKIDTLICQFCIIQKIYFLPLLKLLNSNFISSKCYQISFSFA